MLFGCIQLEMNRLNTILCSRRTFQHLYAVSFWNNEGEDHKNLLFYFKLEHITQGVKHEAVFTMVLVVFVVLSGWSILASDEDIPNLWIPDSDENMWAVNDVVESIPVCHIWIGTIGNIRVLVILSVMHQKCSSIF